VNFTTEMNGEQLAASIAAALPAAGVTPVVIGNRINLVGGLTASAGDMPAGFVEGAVGVTPGAVPVPLVANMNRIQVATAIKGVLESRLTEQVILATNGLNFIDGDTFTIDDGVVGPVTYELESGFTILVPAGAANLDGGGIADGDTFTISDGGGNDVTLEFDSDGSNNPAHVPIPVSGDLGRLAVMQQIEATLNALSENKRNQLGIQARVVNGGVQIVGAPGTTLTINTKPFAPDRVFSNEPSGDDDGSISNAVPTGLRNLDSVTTTGTIGDGDFGLTSGDYDWYRVPNLTAGQVMTVRVDARDRRDPSLLDSSLGIYDASGTLLAFNDDVTATSSDSFLAYPVPASGDYYVVVHGNGNQFQANPADSGSGPGVGTTGDYDLTIQIDTGLVAPTPITSSELDADPLVVPPADDGSRFLANPTDLSGVSDGVLNRTNGNGRGIVGGRGAVRSSGFIGDGPFGLTSGDYDW
jgi:hypothetical protein